MDLETLAKLLKSQLNITWSDEVTDERINNALHSAIPMLCAKVGLCYVYQSDAVLDGLGNPVDLTEVSQVRHLLILCAAYIYDQQGHLFDANYRTEIDACRQAYELVAARVDAEAEASDGTESAD